MSLIPVLVALALLAQAAPAQSLTIVAPDRRVQAWVDSAAIPLPRGSLTVRYLASGDPVPDTTVLMGAYGVTLPSLDTIYLGTYGHNRRTFYHEIGHVLWARISLAQKQAFQQIMHDSTPPDSQSGYGATNPEERFAEAVALTAMHVRIKRSYHGYYNFAVRPATAHRLRVLMFQINGG